MFLFFHFFQKFHQNNESLPYSNVSSCSDNLIPICEQTELFKSYISPHVKIEQCRLSLFGRTIENASSMHSESAGEAEEAERVKRNLAVEECLNELNLKYTKNVVGVNIINQ